jgi:hypothetical protein
VVEKGCEQHTLLQTVSSALSIPHRIITRYTHALSHKVVVNEKCSPTQMRTCIVALE